MDAITDQFLMIIVYWLHCRKPVAVIDPIAHSKCNLLIKHDIKAGSMERSTNLKNNSKRYHMKTYLRLQCLFL
jgi:hypothetical protein